MLWLRALSFFLLAPGVVLGVVPHLILRGERRFGAATGVGTFLGTPLVLAGVLGLLWCFALFVRRGRGTPAPYDPPRALVAEGPYAVSRNPMYVCLWIALAGEVRMAHSGRLALYALGVAAATALFVRLYEEPALRRTFGPEYDAYRARVPRWLGRPRDGDPLDAGRPAT